ncbi:hypothetical protein [Enterobacter chengduensis]|uniref:hypothetical protein n=1 Tax=Enterobacter chengduensis TaxID=2494701 RepID=UPI00254BD8D8|nr:hypothetical protein [Enterobacter chengduensis]MDL0069397.1 hypothetical protein [Enterobacter chengduensis]
MISYEVEFPTQKSFSLKINGYSSVEGLDCKTVEAIGGDVKVQFDKKTLLTVPYREDISSGFTLEGYKQRAVQHSKEVINLLISAALRQTATFNVGNGCVHITPINVTTRL